MIPWELLGRVKAPGGSELSLHRRDKEYVIRVDGYPLMGSRAHGSEDSLAQLGCAGFRDKARPRVLIGGLGMGYTVRAALDVLGPKASVDVAELVPAVIAWNRGPLSHLAGAPTTDRRVTILQGDVVPLIAKSRDRYDAMLLDVDNGPNALTSPTNARLYGPLGLARSWTALKSGGVLAIWSASDDPRFTVALEKAGYHVRIERALERHNGTKKRGKRHVLWLAQKPV
ncbi:MAG: hypothetical protein JWN04_2101 [Myxococcaceae bacterium]|nr:hypothetical protein [Myxococcaceae bacterium]